MDRRIDELEPEEIARVFSSAASAAELARLGEDDAEIEEALESASEIVHALHAEWSAAAPEGLREAQGLYEIFWNARQAGEFRLSEIPNLDRELHRLIADIRGRVGMIDPRLHRMLAGDLTDLASSLQLRYTNIPYLQGDARALGIIRENVAELRRIYAPPEEPA